MKDQDIALAMEMQSMGIPNKLIARELRTDMPAFYSAMRRARKLGMRKNNKTWKTYNY